MEVAFSARPWGLKCGVPKGERREKEYFVDDGFVLQSLPLKSVVSQFFYFS